MVLLSRTDGGLFMSEVHQQTLAIETLARDRCEELGLKPVELVRRCGYQNMSKGLRRLEQLRAGDFAGTSGPLRTLPAALQVPVDVVEEAVQATQRYLCEAAEAAWRAAFRPHAVIITERTIPQPIFMACMIGVDTLPRPAGTVTARGGGAAAAYRSRELCRSIARAGLRTTTWCSSRFRRRLFCRCGLHSTAWTKSCRWCVLLQRKAPSRLARPCATS